MDEWTVYDRHNSDCCCDNGSFLEKQTGPVSDTGGSVLDGRRCFFLCLLVYTLFFALPFEETYVEESRYREAYTEGMYALCRHPGVLWFAGVYLCIAMLWKSEEGILFSAVMVLLNLFYVIFQDVYSFPRTFSNYQEYKKSTPFLIPNGKSIQRCRNSRRGAEKK